MVEPSKRHRLAASEQTLPDDRTELVARAFRSVLGISAVDFEGNFFELGGNSLHATRLINIVRTTCGKELTFEAFFSAPTVMGVVEALELAKPARARLALRNK